jgi:hypothetical protein
MGIARQSLVLALARRVPERHRGPAAPRSGIMKSRPHSLFCPFCNAKGSIQPVLSPMVMAEVRLAADATEAQRGPLVAYKCQRCGYGEIHDRAVDAA